MNLVENLNLISLETTFKKDNLILFAKVYSLLKLKMNKLKEFDLTFEELNNFGILLLNEIEKWDIPKVIIYLNENFSSSLEQNKFYLHSLEYFAGNYPEFVRYYLVEIFDKVSSLKKN